MQAAGLPDAEAKDIEWRSCGYVREAGMGRKKFEWGRKAKGTVNESWDTSSVSWVLWH